VIIAALFALAVTAGAPPSPAGLEGGLAGRWSGALTYRDYRTDKRFTLPVERAFAAATDGATVTEVSTYDDGPETGAVIITTVSLFDAKAGQVTAASFRKGETPELTRRHVVIARYDDPTHWSLVFDGEGRDNNAPARIRVTETRTGDELTSREDVAPLTPDGAPYTFRNETALKRVAGGK